MLQIIQSDQITMGTREIADMLGKNHSDIKRSADRLSAAGILTQPLAELPFEHRGNTYTEYRLAKRDCLVLVAQNCPEFTAVIVDRWQELESQQAPRIPQTLSEALRLAADLEDQKNALQQQLTMAAPKVEFVDKYVSATGNIGFRQLAKLLKVKEPELRAFLFDQKIMYRLGGNLTPFQNHIDAGRFEVKAGMADHGDTNHAYSQAKITPKGVEWLAGELAKHQARQAVRAANDNGGAA